MVQLPGIVRAASIAYMLCCGLSAGAADPLPIESPYRGEIRRDSSGALIVVPFQAKQAVTAPAATGRVLHVGPQRSLRTIAAAAKAAQDGDTIEIEAGDYVSDVAVWTQDRLVIRGVGGHARLIASGASAESKAIWVIRGGHVTVENIEFSGTRVPHQNGAGIRFEKGHLVVRNCRFWKTKTAY